MKDRLDARSAAVTFFFAALILYGSLYPFHFHALDLPHGLLAAFWATARQRPEFGDTISNILLYFPPGFFAVRCLPRVPSIWRVLLSALLGAALSTSIELAQFYDSGRGPSLFDAVANTAGMAMGAVTGVTCGGVSVVMVLLAAWFGSRLLPYVPSLDPHKYAVALRALLAPIDCFEVFRTFALWLAVAALLQAAFDRRSKRVLLGGIIFVFAARIVILDTSLSGSELAGAAIAAILWIACLARVKLRTAIVCSVFVVFVTLEAMRPFHFAPYPRRFGWIPFRSFMDGPREGGSRVFLEKTFIYGCLLWLLRRAGLSLQVATIWAFTLVLSLRLMQVYLPGRSAEITDAMMVLIFAGFMSIFPV